MSDDPRNKLTLTDIHLEVVRSYMLVNRFADGLVTNALVSNELAARLMNKGFTVHGDPKDVTPVGTAVSTLATPEADGLGCNYRGGVFNLSITKDGLVSLWDSERGAMNGKTDGEITLRFSLTTAQIESLRHARKRAR